MTHTHFPQQTSIKTFETSPVSEKSCSAFMCVILYPHVCNIHNQAQLSIHRLDEKLQETEVDV